MRPGGGLCLQTEKSVKDLLVFVAEPDVLLEKEDIETCLAQPVALGGRS